MYTEINPSIKLGKSNFEKGFISSALDKQPFGIELAFTTSDVEKTMKRGIESGAVLLEKVISKPWGQKVGYLRDLNGFIIEICSPMSLGKSENIIY